MAGGTTHRPARRSCVSNASHNGADENVTHLDERAAVLAKVLQLVAEIDMSGANAREEDKARTKMPMAVGEESQ